MRAYPVLQSIRELERLGSILAIQDGNHGEKHPVSTNYVESGIPFIMAKDIFEGTVDLQKCKFLRKEHADSLRVGFARKGDVLLTHKGTVGQVAIAPSVEDYLMLTPQVTYYRIEPAKLNNNYFLYALREPGFQDRIKSVSGQSTRPYVGITAQRDLQVLIHLLPTQRKIAAILSAYDDLIENNLRRIKILEEMAQNLYREWFVKFRFPGHEQARFVDSDLGRIPEGWEVVKVGEILKKVNRGVKIQKQDYALGGLIPVIDQGKEFVGGFTDDVESLISDDLPLIVFGDHTRILKYIDFPFACGADGTQLLKSNENRMPSTLFYYALSAIDLSDFAYARHFKFLKEETIYLPIQSIADRFDHFVLQLCDHIRTSLKKNATLRRTRDLLLPKLISGEVDVSELDITIPEEASSA